MREDKVLILERSDLLDMFKDKYFSLIDFSDFSLSYHRMYEQSLILFIEDKTKGKKKAPQKWGSSICYVQFNYLEASAVAKTCSSSLEDINKSYSSCEMASF